MFKKLIKMEMQQSQVTCSPNVLSGQTVIMVQPREENQPSRRPIPVNTSDWVSTPRTQLSAVSGSHFLANVEQLEIQQIVDLSTLLGKSENRFQYRVKVPKAETLFLAMETKSAKRSNNCSSKFFNCDFSLSMLDHSGETAFVMNMNSRWTYTLNKLHKITVEGTNPIGTVEENFSLLGSNFTVYNIIRKELCRIYGPNICGCCMYEEALFQVISSDGSHQIASIIHQWDSALHDYTMLIVFPENTDIKLKCLLLGAAFLVEHIFFKRLKKTLS